MPKINRIRFVNYRYNDGSRVWIDKTFRLHNGENTLFTLVNGGGKTVFIQGILQAINPNTNLGDRQWKGFLDKPDQPCYILVEWLLDDNAGYATTGAVFQKDGSGIKSYSFVTQYGNLGSALDIQHLPVTMKEDNRLRFTKYKEFRLWLNKQRENYRSKGLYQALSIFDTKKDHRARLQELNINPAEWSGLMVEINKLEGGMNKVFEGCNTTESVLRNLVLKEVELKLSREQANTMGESNVGLFDRSREHLKRLSQDRSRMEDQIQLKNDLELFNTQVTDLFLPKEAQYTALIQQRFHHLRQLTHDHQSLEQFEQDLMAEESLLKQRNAELEVAQTTLKMEQASYRFHEVNKKLAEATEQWRLLEESKSGLIQQKETLETKLATIQASQYYFKIKELKDSIQSKEETLERLNAKVSDITKQIEYCKGKLNYLLNQEISTSSTEERCLAEQIQQLETTLQDLFERSTQEFQQLTQDRAKLSKVEALIDNLNQTYQTITAQHPEWASFDVDIHQVVNNLEDEQQNGKALELELNEQIAQNKQQLADVQLELKAIHEKIQHLNQQITEVNLKLTNLQAEKHQNHQRLLDFYELTPTGVEAILGLELNEVYDRSIHLHRMEEFMTKLESKKEEQTVQLTQLKKSLEQLKHGFHLEIPEKLIQWLDDNQIPYTRGVDYLKEFYHPTDPLHHSIIPYTLIISDQDVLSINQLAETLADDVFMPILTRTQLKELTESFNEATDLPLLSNTQTPGWLSNFNPQWLDDQYVEQLIQQTIQEIHELDREFSWTKTTLNRVQEIKVNYSTFTATADDERILTESFNQLTHEKEMLIQEEELSTKKTERIVEQTEAIQKQITQLIKQNLQRVTTIEQAKQLLDLTAQLELKESEQVALEEVVKKQEWKTTETQKEIQLEQTSLGDLKADLNKVKLTLDNLKKEQIAVKDAKEVETSESINKLEQDLKELRRQQGHVSQEIVIDELTSLRTDLNDYQSKFDFVKEKATPDYQERRATFNDEKDMIDRIKSIEGSIDVEIKKVNKADKAVTALTTEANVIKGNIASEFNQEPRALELINTQFDERQKVIDREKDAVNRGFNVNKKQQEQMKHILSVARDSLNLIPQEFVEAAKVSLTHQDLSEPHLLNFEDLNETLVFMKNEKKVLMKEIKVIEDFEEKWVTQINDLIISTTDVSLLNDLNFLLRTEQHFKKREVTEVCKTLKAQINRNTIQLQKLEKDLEGLQRSMDEFVKDCVTHIETIYREIKLFGRNVSIRWDGEKKNLINLTVPQRSHDLELKVQTYAQSLVQTLAHYYKTDRVDEVDGYILKSINMISLLELITPVADYRLHLFKIEIIAEQSAYRRWEDLVSKASGGERFFASFVLCAALLTYSRSGQVVRDIQKIGKVLVMDNPFGVVTSDHLLKPVFELAKQLNIQMLCFTGINDINIFNHFKLIYSLRIETVNSNQYSYLDYDVINRLESPQEFFYHEQMSLLEA